MLYQKEVMDSKQDNYLPINIQNNLYGNTLINMSIWKKQE